MVWRMLGVLLLGMQYIRGALGLSCFDIWIRKDWDEWFWLVSSTELPLVFRVVICFCDCFVANVLTVDVHMVIASIRITIQICSVSGSPIFRAIAPSIIDTRKGEWPSLKS